MEQTLSIPRQTLHQHVVARLEAAGFTEVRSGLVPGDKVVLQGNRQVYTAWLTGGVPPKQEDD